jgi:hypothetical protein
MEVFLGKVFMALVKLLELCNILYMLACSSCSGSHVSCTPVGLPLYTLPVCRSSVLGRVQDSQA